MRVMTVGTWDLLHEGHRNLFRRCAALGEVFIGVNTDRFVLEYKGLVPHDSEVTRLLNVRPFGREFLHDDRMEDDLRRFRPDVIVVGSDWARKDYHAQIKVSQDVLDSLNVSVMYVPATPGISSTELRARRRLVMTGWGLDWVHDVP